MKSPIENRIERLSLEERKLLFFKAKQLLAAKSNKSGTEDTKRLVAYVATKDKLSIDQLRGSLKAKVPDYMIPSRIVMVEQFPVLPNGKVDMKALKLIDGLDEVKEAAKTVEPTNDIERKLLDIWKEVLNLSNIGIHDNFFDIGGDSLLSIQIISSARKLGIMLSPNQLFDYQTISELSKSVSTRIKELKPWEHLVEIRSEGSKAPLFCLHTDGSHFFFYNLLAKYLDSDRPIYALQASSVKDKVKLHRTVEEMASDFVDEIKRVQPQGPYHFMAYCFSTAVGLEIAHILNKNKERVHYLVADTSSRSQNLYAISRTGSRVSGVIKVLLKNPVKTVKRAVKQRIIWYVKPAILRRFGNEDQRKVEKLSHNNLKIYHNYQWKAFDGHLSLLLTKKPYHPGLNEYILDSWKKIALRGLNIVQTEGQHDTLFSEPDVKHTAENLENCMQEFEANNSK